MLDPLFYHFSTLILNDSVIILITLTIVGYLKF